MLKNLNKYLAELIGTFALVFAGCGAIVSNDVYGGTITHVGVSLVFGLTVAAMIYSIGDISGAHINPAVTLGFCFIRKISAKEAGFYIAAQLTGAVAASAFLFILYPSHATLGSTIPSGTYWQSFSFEIILSFLLMFVILNVSTGAKEKGIMAGASIGATVALAAIFAGPVSGASMNPARSIGPALISGNLDPLWIYIAGPVIGVLAACLLSGVIQEKDRRKTCN